MGRKCERCGEVFSQDPEDRDDMADPSRCPSCGEQHGTREPDGSDDDVLEVTVTVRVPSEADVEIQGGDA